MICPNCAADNREGAAFCVACGSALGGAAGVSPSGGLLSGRAPAACEACNAALRPGSLFCHRCGRPVSAALPTAPPAEEVPCANCGRANRPGARFCLSCGLALTVVCGQCRAENRAAAKFCLVCGQPLGADAAAVGALPPPVTTDPPPQRSGPRRSSEIACEFCGQATYAGARFCPHCGQSPTSRLLAVEAMYSTGKMPEGHKVRGSAGDDYLILRLIAQGGMGAVYEVGRMTDGTRWAMKEMSETALARGDRATTVAKFQEEAEFLRELKHDNLPKVVDVFEFNRRHYLVMELIEGRTLGAMLEAQGGPLPEKDVVDWGAQLCRVLAYLHTRRPPVIYRDLKPDNIMLDAVNGRIKLIDFGIARRFKGGKKSDTLMLGTKGYAAPEQFGKRETDARADLYALGATLHHLLTDESPTNRPQLFNFPPLESYGHVKVSRRTGEAIKAATALYPEDRPANAAALYKALTGKIMPPPPPPTQPSPQRSGQILSAPEGQPLRSRPSAVAAMLTGRAEPAAPLDLGTVQRGQSPGGSVPVDITAGTLPVESRTDWLAATPDQVAPGRNEVRVTARTAGLSLGQEPAPVTYRPRFVVDWVWWLLLRLHGGHVSRLVPAPRRHEGVVRVGQQEVAVAVTVTPTPRQVRAWRFVSAAAVVLEMAVVILAIGIIIAML